jgi:hypothetical protein
VSFPINSQFGEFNSRLGRCKFPVRPVTGYGWQEFDFAFRFTAELRKIDEITGSTVKG